MKILIIRPWGKTAFELSRYCSDALEQIGHTVSIFTYNDERISSRVPFLKNVERGLTKKTLMKKISVFSPQLILVIKGDRIHLEVILNVRERFRIPVANYWIDDPHYVDVSRTISPSYDFFFTNDPDCVQIHKESGCSHVGFLSFGCVSNLHRKVQLSQEEYKEYGSDICFAGTVSKGRLKALEALSDYDLRIWSPRIVSSFREDYRIVPTKLSPSSPLYFKFTDRAVWGEELVKVYNASKIVLNIHSPQPVPIMRDFEVTGCGAFLLTDHARRLDSMFKPGEEIVCASSVDELREMVDYYLSHPGERDEIAKKGQIRAYQDHTYTKRMEELISFVKVNTP
jgi:spore maturation protein CgeB